VANVKIRRPALLCLVSVVVACGNATPPAASPSAPVAAVNAPAPVEAKVEASQPALSMYDLQLRSLRDYVKAFNRHDAKAVAALYAPGAVFIERGSPATASPQAIQTDYQNYFDTYPDVTTAITRSWHWGDAALFEYVEGGTQSGQRIVLPPPPQRYDPISGDIDNKAPPRTILKATGKKFGYVGASLLRFTPEGLVRLDTTYADELTREVQSGFAPGQLAKLAVRSIVPVPAPSDTWETHKLTANDVGQANVVATRTALYKKFSVHSEKAFLAALSDDVVLSPFDDPKDAHGKKEASALLKEWDRMFPDSVEDASEGWSVDGYVVILGTFAGKRVAAWGPLKPTDKTFKTHFLDILKVNKDDKVERLWSYANNYELLQYLGYDDGTHNATKKTP
jgi:ketosteroid isomerase-like protein